MTQEKTEMIQSKPKTYGKYIVTLIICGLLGVAGSLALSFTENMSVAIVVAIFSSTLLIIAAITDLQSEVIEYFEKNTSK